MAEGLDHMPRPASVVSPVQNDEVQASEMIGAPALSSGTGLGLEPVDEINHVIGPAASATTDATSRDGDGKVSLAGAGSADQHGVALLGDESAAGQLVDEGLVDRGGPNWKSSRSLASGNLAMVSWYLIGRLLLADLGVEQIAKLEEEIDRLQRTEEAIVVASAPREAGCPPWVVLVCVKAVDAPSVRAA